MSIRDFIQIVIFVTVLVLLAPPLGQYMARVFDGKRTLLHPVLGWLERLIYRFCGVGETEEMNWRAYAGALLWFNAIGFGIVFVLQMIQKMLPLNPAGLGNVQSASAFNTAVSFMTNTNWQSYAGETTLSYLTQMLGLTVQNFVSAGTGIAVMLALIRGIVKKTSVSLGNFWVNLTRSVVYVLLPLSIVLAVVLVGQGAVQTFSPAIHAITIEGTTQTIPLGPAASQIAIKQLGTNGGGFFDANSAHPFENPTPLSNFLEMLAILIIPAGLVFTYGRMANARRHAIVIFGVMLVLFMSGLALSLYSENIANPALGIKINLEGKETRFGNTNSVLWSVATTAASNGSVNAMHSSLSPLSGGVAIFNIMLGEIVFGGVGAGMYGMLLFIMLAVFLAGLMVGRTPEYLGKKIEAHEVQMAILAILLTNAVILIGSGMASVLPIGLAGPGNRGPHGFSEILYAFTSAAGNNGSAFAGLNANSNFYNIALGIAMLIGRFGVIMPCLAIAGSLVTKKISPPSSGSFATDNFIFAIILIAVILIVGALTFMPALCLGPIVEHLLMRGGIAF
jgi:potassium-transporting ATPase potassium-binding subunit